MNFPLRTHRGHDTALSSPLLERLGILKHRGSSGVRVWLNCTGLLDGLTIHKQHYKAKASCPSYWLQKTSKGGLQSIKYYLHSSEKDAAEDKGYCHLPSSESDAERLEKPIGRPKAWSQSKVWWDPDVLNGMNLNYPLKPCLPLLHSGSQIQTN